MPVGRPAGIVKSGMYPYSNSKGVCPVAELSRLFMTNSAVGSRSTQSSLSFADEEAQVSFNFLILTLYLAIGLRMIGSRETCVYPESFI